ncbi:ATP-binding protein [Limisalsivibrio acetivorans]|uniref:ATP-binding protein n=1 Tax=Limisalsivibrio acetivorans TaxID=1304888 RepID=UPI0003B45125|nr:ATP-binding protein [Limisalsivibrio acetivorans]
MKLRTKVTLILSLTSLATLIIIAVYSYSFLLKTFTGMEKKLTDRMGAQVVNMIDMRFDSLQTLSTELCQEMAQQVIQNNPSRLSGKLENHIADCILAAQGMSLNTICTEGNEDLGEALSYAFLENREIRRQLNSNGSVTGISETETGYVMLSASNSKSTEGEPVQILSAALIDEPFIRSLGSALEYSLKLTEEFPLEGQDNIESSYGKVLRTPIDSMDDSEMVLVYRDLASLPAFGIQYTYQRPFYNATLLTVHKLVTFIVIIMGITIPLTLFLLQRSVFRRLTGNINLINEIGNTGDIGRRIPNGGDDEIGNLIQSINWMLEKLEQNQNYIQENQKAQVEAETENRMKTAFLANVSHEIRTPINGIIGMTELLMETTLDSTQLELVQILDNENRALFSLINNVLDLSKIEAGKLELEETPFSISSVVEPMVKSHVLKARKKGLDFFLFIDPSIPRSLMGDPGKIRQTLTNLISNSIKFTSKGNITLKLSLMDKRGDSVEILFEVIDTGAGIALEKQMSIFESFSQEDASTTRRYGGTGLGLSIVKSLVHLMGGKISLESEKDAGSRFYFTLRLRKDPEGDVELDRTFEGMPVVTVTDSEEMRFILSKYYSALGIESTFVQRPEDACAVGDQCRMIVLDAGKNEREEINMLERFSAGCSCDNAVKVLLSYPDKRVNRYLLEEHSFAGVMTKPTGIEGLVDMLYALDEKKDGAIIISEDHEKDKIIRTEPGKTFHILLVDDYPVNQTVALRHLVRSGLKVDLAENGRDAVEMFKENKYDLILMDIQMPVMDGFSATKLIRAFEKGLEGYSVESRTPIIALTAHAQQGYREKCKANEMDDYITKPLRKETLVTQVFKWLRREDDSKHEELPQDEHQREEMADCPLDYNELMEDFGGDRDFILELVGDFLTVNRAKLILMKQAIKDAHGETLSDMAHAVKGGAKSIAARCLARQCAEMEELGSYGDFKKAAETYPLVIEELEKIRVMLAEETGEDVHDPFS